jgi:hypothetical protein
MEPVKVPQHLEVADVVAWGLSVSDLVCVVGGCALGWWLYLAAPEPLALRVVVALLPPIVGVAVGIPRVGDRAAREWLAIIAAFLIRARVLVSGDRS